VVAIVPAYNRADTVGPTVAAVCRLAVDEVVVVDDGSTDDTADVAGGAGARVVRLPANVGKGGAVAAGLAATPDADVYLLVDADLGASAGATAELLAPVLGGEADMVIAVPPGAGRRGGFGVVRRLAASGIARTTGWRPRAPLSGQRAVRAELLRRLELAPRFGLETALTIDALRAGARVSEVDLDLDHRHTGRGVSGVVHRGRQGRDLALALWHRRRP
jgi:glycosyltransferase involved in cell wall biosynthesis